MTDTKDQSPISEKFFKFAVDSSINHIIITDKDGIILYANQAAEKTTGFTFAEMKGNTPRLWGKQMAPEFYPKMWATIKTEKKSFKGELTNKRKNGEQYTAIATISPILDIDQTLLGFIGIEEDISSLKKAQTELIDKSKELESINRLMIGRELKMVELKEEIKKLKNS